MSRRRRAAALFAAAVGCAVLAASLTSGYGDSLAERYGPLRPVLVAAADLPRGKLLDPRRAARLLEVRQIPQRFVPPGALVAPGQAIGQAPLVTIGAGNYLLSPQLRLPRSDAPKPPSVPGGRTPVELTVSGGEAIVALGVDPRTIRVDVVVTTEQEFGDPGRTYVAAPAVDLLALVQSPPSPGTPAGVAGWSATLALDRDQALELIEAEAFAHDLRLLPSLG